MHNHPIYLLIVKLKCGFVTCWSPLEVNIRLTWMRWESWYWVAMNSRTSPENQPARFAACAHWWRYVIRSLVENLPKQECRTKWSCRNSIMISRVWPDKRGLSAMNAKYLEVVTWSEISRWKFNPNKSCERLSLWHAVRENGRDLCDSQ